MAAKQLGEYSLEFVSFRYSPGTAGSAIVEGITKEPRLVLG